MELIVTEPGRLVSAVRVLDEEIDRMDRLASRFRHDSEVSRLHRGAGTRLVVSPELLELVEAAVMVARATGGAVDPTVGGALCRLGYDRDFAEVAGGVDGDLPDPHPVPGWRSIVIDRPSRTVRTAPGTMLDLGATAKALVADRVAHRVGSRLGCGVLVSLGGDMAVGGVPPPEGFAVGLADVCTDPEPSSAVSIASGGLATSGISARRWRLGSRVVHHIVDPATGRPATPVWRTVSVAASSCLDANAASTASLVKGADALHWLGALALPARLVAVDGTVHRVAGWPAEDGALTGGEAR
ncbi:MAG: FAD:protein FMN transferase [Acidimicrobiales bacterium]